MMAQLRSFCLLSFSRSSPMGVTRKHECRSLEKMMPSRIVLHHSGIARMTVRSDDDSCSAVVHR